ncbi:MAG: hypothetical protein GY793_00645, partial [Proteobacteria bacterium]|nr:hypothetical protein [Pseudomonadota bacterium]
MEIISTTCVNSKRIADFLAKPQQEYCQCFGQCKVRVKSKSGYIFILNEKEIKQLKKHEK